MKLTDERIRFTIHRSLNSFSLSFLSHVKNCNHKGLGIYYLLSAFIFGISGTLISVLLRIELYSSGNRIFIEKFLIFIEIENEEEMSKSPFDHTLVLQVNDLLLYKIKSSIFAGFLKEFLFYL